MKSRTTKKTNADLSLASKKARCVADLMKDEERCTREIVSENVREIMREKQQRKKCININAFYIMTFGDAMFIH